MLCKNCKKKVKLLGNSICVSCLLNEMKMEMLKKEQESESESESESQSETWSDMRDEYWDGDSYYEEIFEK